MFTWSTEDNLKLTKQLVKDPFIGISTRWK